MGNADEAVDATTPAERLSITRLETLKVIADPLRQQLIDLLRRRPATVKQLAAELGVSPKKLYYHINLLLEHGLIRVVGTRMVSGILEKQYRATAYLFILDDALPNGSTLARDQSREALLSTILTLTENDIRQGVRSGLIDLSADAPLASSLLMEWTVGQMTEEQAVSFYTRLQALREEFPPLRGDAPDAKAYRLMLALFPTTSHTPSSDGNREEEAHG